MKNKTIKKDKTFQLIIVKERILSAVISIVISLSVAGGSFYVSNKFFVKKSENGKSFVDNKINTEKIYRGTINLEKEEVEFQRDVAEGVKDGFDEYEDYKPNFQPSSSSEKPLAEGNLSDDLVVVDNSSITGKNLKIFEGKEFNPIKDLNLRATDINGKDISDKIIILENNVDIYSPGQYIVKAAAPLSNESQKEIILTVNVQPVNLNISVNNFEAISEVVNKGENAILNLDLYTNKEYISALTVNINGINYPVKKIEARNKSQKYTVEVPVGNEGGLIEQNLSSITMSDNTVIEVNQKSNVVVVKDKPVISSFTYEERKTKEVSKILMKICLEDKDNALLDRAWVYIYDESNDVVASQAISSNRINNVNFTVSENGRYTVKVVGDLDLAGELSKNEELFVDIIEVTSVDKTNLTGENIKIKLGSDFEPIRDLNIKALDVDGTDITNEVIIEGDKVDVNTPGKYIVKVLLVNKNNEEIRKEFTVEVVSSIVRRILGIDSEDNNDEEIIANNEESRSITSSNPRSISNIVSGNDTETLYSDLIINGTILDGNGSVPDGRIEVELPTKVTFTVDQVGNFIGSTFTVTNKSACDVKLSVAQFVEENPIGGITINNSITDFTDVGRATVGLQLNATANGISKIVNLDKTISNVDLVTVGANDSAAMRILGNAGKSTSKDENGASESFILKFRIKKA